VGPESKFWNKIVRKLRNGDMFGHWERVEVKMPLGLPDTIVKLSTRVIFVELKAVERESQLKHELRPEQAGWIDKWNNVVGGEAYVLAYISSLNRMQWYIEGRQIRRGVYTQVPVPTGVYAPTYSGSL
jgi:hypothetical protein